MSPAVGRSSNLCYIEGLSNEAGYAGVYLLLGDQNGEPFASIVEGGDIDARIAASVGAAA